MRHIKMTIGSVVLEAEILETPTAEAIWNALPFTSKANTWGKAKGDVKQLQSVKSGAPIKVEKAG